MLFKLAWRNIWRNRTRTIITLAAVFLAVIMSTIMSSMKEGMYSNMIKSMIGSYSGFAQIHSTEFVEDSEIDNSLIIKQEMIDVLESSEGINDYLPRIQSGALAYKDSDTITVSKMVSLIGVDPDKEKEFIQLNERVVEGEYFTADDQAVMIGAGLAERMKIGVGDAVILKGQGYYGATADGLYSVKGIVKFGAPELSNSLIFMPLKEAQFFHSMDSVCTNIILDVEHPEEVEQVVASIADKLGKDYTVRDWKALNTDLINMIETDRVEGYVFMFILYFVIALGLFSTMLMMLSERMHEFGVLISIGMKRFKLAIIVWMEMISISFLGAIIGMALAFPICATFYYNPVPLPEETAEMMEEYGIEAVIQFSIDPSIFIQQGAIVFLISCLIAVYPLIKLLMLNAQKAMRS